MYVYPTAYRDSMTNMRGLRLLKFADCNNVVLLAPTNHPESGHVTAQEASKPEVSDSNQS